MSKSRPDFETLFNVLQNKIKNKQNVRAQQLGVFTGTGPRNERKNIMNIFKGNACTAVQQ